MYKSNATWTKVSRTDDSHRTKEQALGVCKILLDDYGSEPGCPDRGRCTAAWVEEIEPERCESEGCTLFAEYRDPMGNNLCSDCIQGDVGCGEYTWEECEVLK